ncbi:MAG: DinB family protein [Planctomycetota bacterium]
MIPAIQDARAVLARTPAVLRAQLAELDDAWLHADEGPGTYSPFDVLGHLISGERTDWIPRLRCIVEHGEARTFEPFDRDGFRASLRDLDARARLDAFEAERRRSLSELDQLVRSEADLARAGTHPAFGRVTLGELLSTWVVHDLGHLAQIARAMAKRYGDAVGPWRAYLPILEVRQG